MAGRKRYAAVAVAAAALITAPTAAYGVPPAEPASAARPAHGTAVPAHAPVLQVAKTAPTARIVAPDGHVTEPGGAEFG